MAYSELIKNFNRIREYMREFYVYGFKSRDEYTKKSARSYDDERRRLESWLGDAMRFRQTPEGKSVFISIDSRVSRHNPLYAAWKTKSFTDGDITLHFILFDILHDHETALSLAEIMEQIDMYLQNFHEPRVFDESTVRKKLKEYIVEGILAAEKHGKTVCYRRADTCCLRGSCGMIYLKNAQRKALAQTENARRPGVRMGRHFDEAYIHRCKSSGNRKPDTAGMEQRTFSAGG